MRARFPIGFGIFALSLLQVAGAAPARSWPEIQRLALQRDLRAAAPRVQADASARLRSFAGMIPVFDLLVRERTVSPCASFAFLSRVLYETLDRDPEAFMDLAPYYLADVTTLRSYRRRLERRMRSIPGSRLVLKTEYLPSWEAKREERGVPAMPPWLSEHYGLRHEDVFVPAGARFSPAYGTGGQGLRDGYRQEDHDDSGRHDHYLMNVALGFALEKSRLPRVLRYVTVPGLLVDRVNRALGPLADRESEGSQGPNDAGSATDVDVNRRGRAQGARFALEAPRNGLELNARVYGDVCNESLMRPTISGPLTPAALGDAYEDAARSVRGR